LRLGFGQKFVLPGAVCNKLLKQVFAVAKSGLIYDDNYPKPPDLI